MESEGVKKSERFSSGGTAVGAVGLVCVVAVLAVGTFESAEGFPLWGYPCGVAVAVMFWAVLMRPGLVLGARDVELRNIFHSRWVPYALITEVEVKQVTTIHTADDKYVASGFGRTRRNIRRDAGRRVDDRPADPSVGWLVEQKLERRIDDARYATGEPGQVRHVWAWPEIAALSLAALATLLLAILG